MEEKENEEQSPHKPEGPSLLRNAVAEYELALGRRQAGGKPEKGPRRLVAVPQEGVADNSAEAKPRKGANPARGKSVLGRGLSALMSASAVSIDPDRTRPAPNNAPFAHPFAKQPDNSDEAAAPVRPLTEIKPNNVDANAESNGGGEPLSEILGDQAPEGGLLYLAIERIHPNTVQPRQHFAAEEIESLAKSIAESGLLQPVVVRKRKGETGPLAAFELVAGERRWRAAQKAGLQRIPALVRNLNDRESLELAIVENVQRSDLNAIEEARAYSRLIAEFGATQEEVARGVGKDRVSVANALRLLKLSEEVQGLIFSGTLSAGHGRALLMLDEASDQKAVAEKAVSEQLSVRAVENIAKRLKAGEPLETVLGTAAERPTRRGNSAAAPAEPASPRVQELEERLRRALGTKVKLTLDARGRGEIKVSVFSEDELQRILERLNA